VRLSIYNDNHNGGVKMARLKAICPKCGKKHSIQVRKINNPKTASYICEKCIKNEVKEILNVKSKKD
jgi:DNA-directed RNA polymerase subunit M/transcription elongation factor TFIIS